MSGSINERGVWKMMENPKVTSRLNFFHGCYSILILHGKIEIRQQALYTAPLIFFPRSRSRCILLEQHDCNGTLNESTLYSN